MRIRILLVLTSIFLSCSYLAAQQRPLQTETTETVGRGHFRFELGFEFLQDAVFPLSGLEGDLSRIGVVGLRFGAGEKVEIQILGTVQDFLNINRRFPAPNTGILDFSGDSTSDVGDFTLATKIQFNKQRPGLPSFGLRFGFEMPNASNESGLGIDESNIFGQFLVEKDSGPLKLTGNLGIAILGDPLSNSAQDDLLLYGASAVLDVTSSINLLAEIYGRTGPGGVGTEDQSRVRAGVQILAGGVYWDIAGFWGLEDTDPSSGIIIGFSKTFDIF